MAYGSRIPAMLKDTKHRLLRFLHLCSTGCILLVVFLSVLMVIFVVLFLPKTILPRLAILTEEQIVRQKSQSESTEGLLFFASGRNPAAALEQGISFLYRGSENQYRLAQALIRSLVLTQFPQELDLAQILNELSDIQFSFLLAKKPEQKSAWVVSLSSLDQKEGENISSLLHVLFAARFPAMEVRTRTMPSGAVVRDIVSTMVPVRGIEETIDGFTVRQSTHQETGELFLSASKGNALLFGNDQHLLLSLLRHPLSGGESFVVTREGLELFDANFPESDVLRYAKALFAGGKEDRLSLSSWRCLP